MPHAPDTIQVISEAAATSTIRDAVGRCLTSFCRWSSVSATCTATRTDQPSSFSVALAKAARPQPWRSQASSSATSGYAYIVYSETQSTGLEFGSHPLRCRVRPSACRSRVFLPLLLSSIIWYLRRGGDAPKIGR